MNIDHFEQLSLNKPILRALTDEGYTNPTPIQRAAIPELLQRKDLMATAQTGTGKTAAFSLPILQLLGDSQVKGKGIRALILAPTRELALQIDASLKTYGRHLRLRTAVVLGGVSMRGQIAALRNSPDILVATPGRLLDLCRQGCVSLKHTEIFVLDEADRMLDMGFIPDVRTIVKMLPESRQTMFFSATMSEEVVKLARGILKDPVKVEITPPASVSQNITQKVMFVDEPNKQQLLTEMLKGNKGGRTLVFTRTKHKANRLADQLARSGISADAIHSNKSQNARQRTLSDFDRGRIKVLVATDIVARGIDVDGISYVINYELPNDPESYVHRIGRTARAGAMGTALSFCSADELDCLRGIEKLTKCKLPADEDHKFHSASVAEKRERAASGGPSRRRPGQRHRRRGGFGQGSRQGRSRRVRAS